MTDTQLKRVTTDVLEIAYTDSGPADGVPVLLMHGFPYDPHCYDDVAARISAAGCRAIVPYLRGYGPTRFLSADTIRSGQQGALGHDLLQLLDVLEIPQAIVAGYDWGGRAACIVAALWPERVRGLVTCCGYNIQNIAGSVNPVAPEQEHRYWYQHYFHTARGRAGLTANRRAFCQLLWRLWSPNWAFDDGIYNASAPSFDNPDFVDVVIQSYRHRYGYASGDPAYDAIEARLATQPAITVPAISLHGSGDGVHPSAESIAHRRHFTGAYERREIPRVGHNVPQEAPAEFAEAVLNLI
ncbi:MAG: alpha/beta hydrolase [Proteobacteria bacterium]|nr:alpha/beta hydrolase [Pseudomonadota bacterium]